MESIKGLTIKAVIIATALLLQSAAWGEVVDCKLEHWRWENSYSGLDVFVEGIVSPVPSTGLLQIYIKAFDGNGQLVGTTNTLVKPDGSFQAFLGRGSNKTNKLKVEVKCEHHPSWR